MRAVVRLGEPGGPSTIQDLQRGQEDTITIDLASPKRPAYIDDFAPQPTHPDRFPDTLVKRV